MKRLIYILQKSALHIPENSPNHSIAQPPSIILHFLRGRKTIYTSRPCSRAGWPGRKNRTIKSIRAIIDSPLSSARLSLSLPLCIPHGRLLSSVPLISRYSFSASPPLARGKRRPTRASKAPCIVFSWISIFVLFDEEDVVIR